MTSKTGWLLILWLALAAGAEARTLRAEIARVRSTAANLDEVALELRWPDAAAQGELVLRAARLDVPALGYVARDITWTCPLRRAEDLRWACAGPLAMRGGPRANLELLASAAGVDGRLALGKRRIGVSTTAAPGLLRADLEAIPVAWLQAFLASLWADGQWREGELAGRVELGLGEATDVRAALDLRGLAMDTPDGLLAAAGVDGRLSLTVRGDDADRQVRAALTTRRGELLAGNLYVLLPEAPVEVEVEARPTRDGGWRLPRLAWRDAGVLEAAGEGVVAADGGIEALALDLEAGDLAIARDRYLSGFLAPAGFPDLVLSGALSARIGMAGGRATDFDARARGINAIDPRQRFTLAGLEGELRWHAGQGARTSAIGWRNAALFGIGLGAVRFDLSSEGRELALSAPAALDVLEGRLRLEHLRWQAAEPGQGARFQLGVRLDALDLGSLSQRLGWPPFTGQLGGRIPSARYANGVLRLDGGLAMELFDGRLELSDLVMERPFGVAPTLSADVAIEDVDMEPMTAAFGFGSITGRLDGRIAGLRIVDWSPVAFDARLRSDDAWKGKRRISQRAVEDISRIGGAGLMAGLQAQALRLFDDFGYARLGLSCRLRDNVCRMDGVSSAGDGYTIVEGAGLPRIQVVGFRRQVDWPTLVDRLKAATEGQAPVVD